MTYASATDYLLGTINETASRRSPTRLDRMRAFLQHLGDPHLRYPTIHVGGTSGKGSTSTMIAASLSASGKRTGLHTKPHLSSMTERARVDGVPISEDDFAETLEEMMPAIEATAREHGRPSYYETLLALAFVYFARREVDVAVIEVGLGGTLDGTNLVQPEVSIVTNVGLDHTEILGNTREAIAADKVGIAKRGVPLVSYAVGGARAVIEAGCARAGAPFFAVGEHATIEGRPSQTYGQSFAVVTASGSYELALPVLGRFQQDNAATSIVGLERLRPELRPSIADVERGLGQLVVPGRMEFFPGHPSVIFDIAHNPDKAASLAAALRETFPGRRFVFVVGIGETKDAPSVLEPFFALPASFVFTEFETAGRASERPQRLANIAELAGAGARTIVDPVDALAVARRAGDGSHMVVVTGSTFVTGRLRDWWLEHVVERSRR
ncbi:MAG: bifunctional folylpolyglutamate synthase/dihydrofolate synthase [Candidatus Eremiobacteraeota bacterium]|nr:bifunctional folylpolyglutamate synthase/dihydrofolate synthase [Candidatus Eremiobacteraeota bacterium]